jgi:ornithine carbamoyltransferase
MKTKLKMLNDNQLAKKKINHFLDIADLQKSEIEYLISSAKVLKQEWMLNRSHSKTFKSTQLAMIFEKASTRTRVSFEVGIRQLGGDAIYLSGQDSQLGRGEPISDTAQVLSRYVDIIMIRTFSHETLTELAKHATVPVINGLTDKSHPCQVMADILTIDEHLGDIREQKIAWFGDYNNMTVSWIEAAEKLGFELRVAIPVSMKPKKKFAKNIRFFGEREVLEAAKGANVITTDTWASMGDKNPDAKEKLLQPFQVNEAVMKQAAIDSIFLHCLPAKRGKEVTAEVIDGKNSQIFDEAENRLHIQKAIMSWCLEG